jgi:hypothetical protein
MNNNQTQNNESKVATFDETPPDEHSGILVQGHLKIFDPDTKEILLNKRNAIHHENLSEAIALSLGNKPNGFISTMAFGNGGTYVDPTGVINYLTTNTNTQNADLYNLTYSKIVDDTDVNNTAPLKNKIEIRHTPGTVYTDILVTCLLDYGEPNNQEAFDNSGNLDGEYVFDELGLKTVPLNQYPTGKLLTHVVFHPIQKSLNRLIQVEYTVRIQTLTSLSSIL